MIPNPRTLRIEERVSKRGFPVTDSASYRFSRFSRAFLASCDIPVVDSATVLRPERKVAFDSRRQRERKSARSCGDLRSCFRSSSTLAVRLCFCFFVFLMLLLPFPLLVILPVFFRQRYVRCLRGLIATKKQDYYFISVLSKINPIAGAVFNLRFKNTLTHALQFAEIASLKPLQSSVDGQPHSSIQDLRFPFSKWEAARCCIRRDLELSCFHQSIVRNSTVVYSRQ